MDVAKAGEPDLAKEREVTKLIFFSKSEIRHVWKKKTIPVWTSVHTFMMNGDD